MVSVLIAEHKEVIRLGLKQVLFGSLQFELAGTVVDVPSLLQAVELRQPHILLVNNELPGMQLAATVRRARELSPETKLVVLLSQPDEFWPALEARAQAYCLREASAEIIISALNAVADGKCYIGLNLASYLLQGDGYRFLQSVSPKVGKPSELDVLSRREAEVMSLLAAGKKNEEIAQELGLSIQTVKVHVKHILKKLNVSDRTQAAIKASKS